MAGILNGALPLWAALLAHLALVEERIDRFGVSGLMLSFVGLAIVIGLVLLCVRDSSTQGALIILLAALSYAGSAVLVRRRLHGVDSTLLAGNQTVLAFICLTPLLLMDVMTDFAALSTKVLLSALALGVLARAALILAGIYLLNRPAQQEVAAGSDAGS